MNGLYCRTTRHGKSQVEVKTRYPLNHGKKSRYITDIYFFSPAQLQMDSAHHSVRNILRDIQSYTRYTSPDIPLSKIIDGQCELSPLTRIRRMLDSVEMGRDVRESKYAYELRMLSNNVRSELRGTVRLLKKQLYSKIDSQQIIERISILMTDIRNLLVALRDLSTAFIDPRLSNQLRLALQWTDELISLEVEKSLFALSSSLPKTELFQPTKEALVGQAGGEIEYRKKASYPSTMTPEDKSSLDKTKYRESMLKKWAQSAMYMEEQTSPVANRLGHILAGVSAAIAMGFAVTASFFAERMFASYSVPWALLVVIAYIFKDRLKEVLRGILVSMMPKIIADNSVNLRDPASDAKVGKIRELIRFPQKKELPVAVFHMREKSLSDLQKILPPEDILFFRKITRVNNRRLLKDHTRLESLTGILRINLASWFSRMDDEKETVTVLDNGQTLEFSIRKLYHVHLIISLSDSFGDAGPVLYHYRLVLNRNGVKTIDLIEKISRGAL